jgi:beta-glucosidase
VVENGMATQVIGSRRVPREDGWDRPRYVRDHLKAMADTVADGVPVTTYLHWSLVDNYEWGTYQPRLGLFGMDRSDAGGAVKWMDTDAQGDDAAGEFSRVVRGLTAGDRSVLDAP